MVCGYGYLRVQDSGIVSQQPYYNIYSAFLQVGCCTPGGLATQGFRIWAKLHVFQINVRVSIANHGDDYISLSIYISISLFISISISFISVYICIYFYLSIYLPRSNYLPTCLPTYLPINLSISIYLFIYIICNYVISN